MALYIEVKNFVFTRVCLFSNNSFNDWQNLNPYIPDHEKSKSHINNFISWKELEKILYKGKTIDCDTENSIAKEKET